MADINDPYPRTRQSPSVAITEWCRYDRLATKSRGSDTDSRQNPQVANETVGNSAVAGGGADVL